MNFCSSCSFLLFYNLKFSRIYSTTFKSRLWQSLNIGKQSITRNLVISRTALSQKKFEKPIEKTKTVLNEDGVLEKKKKKITLERVTLIGADESIKVVTLDDAIKLASRRNLRLLKINDFDPKSNRATYKLVGGQAVKQKSDKNDDFKQLLINAKINDHDLQAKINNIIKWIKKELHVRIVVSTDSGNLSACESIFNKVSEGTKEHGRIVQKITKGNELKFQVLPPKKEKKTDRPEEDQTPSES